MKKLFIVSLFLIILISVLTVTAFAYVGPAFVATEQLNVYDGGGWNCNVIDCLPRNTNVTIDYDAGYGWYKISYDGGSGYVAGYYLLFGYADEPVVTNIQPTTPTVVTTSGNGSISGDAVNFRSGPSLSSTVLDCLSEGTTINIRGSCGEWYEVEHNSTVGYVYGIYVSRNGQVTVEVTTPVVEEQPIIRSSTSDDIVNTAMNYLGVPYVWGGTSEYGLDCSGLVYLVYKQHGITINRVAQDMCSNGTEVSLNDLQPGDILLFGSSIYNIWHVGIYVGDGNLIHSSYGTTVRVNSLDEIVGMKLISARRII